MSLLSDNKNQYVLFAGHHYYPVGGIEDWVATFYADNDTEAVHTAKAYAAGEFKDQQWFQLIAIAKGTNKGFQVIEDWEQKADWEGSFTDPKPYILKRYDEGIDDLGKS